MELMCKSLTPELHLGRRADELLSDPAFLLQWKTLLGQCPWATPLQSPELAGAWYRVYRETHEPLLVLKRDENGLIGLLLLARELRSGKLVCAGGHQAEYQVWICLPGCAEEYPRRALEAVREAFGGADLCFRYLPPRTPTSWLNDSELSRFSLLRACPRPLLRACANGSGALCKKTNKRRMRSLRKAGGVDFRRIADPREFDALLDEMIPCYDQRNLDAYGVAPFAADPLKRRYYSAMMRSGWPLHVTVLRIGGRFASAHVNIVRGCELQLGLTVYDPRLAKFSPGKFHIHLLAQMLAEEGIQQIDLTPGGEPYKQRFATGCDQAYVLEIFGSRAGRWRGALRSRAQLCAAQCLARWDKSPAHVRQWMNRMLGIGRWRALKSVGARNQAM
jgi:CelD/BcsL family acetyltransferase involved in cellulose biosynthesis